MSGANRRRTAETENAILIGIGVGVLVLALLVMWISVHGAAAIDGRSKPPASPVDMIAALARGDTAWTTTTWVLLAMQVTVVAALGVVALLIFRRVRASRLRGDGAARLMGTGRDIAAITTVQARATAARLGMAGTPGLRIGRTVAGGAVVWQGWEDVSVDIWGPRQGKTTSRVIPAIVEAPGAVVVTSNKRDVVDATRSVRRIETADRRVVEPWVFDPQQIVGESPSWWWNPLSYVTGELAAAKMAHTLAAAARPPGSRVDAFFDSAAEELLAGLLLAASRKAGGSLTDVYLWLTRPTDTTPADILAAHHFTLTASSVANHINSPDKQRDGVYGTARTMVRFMTNPETMAWVTPGRRRRPEFSPAEFVRDPAQTIYLLSKEGQGSAGPIMTALTVAITEAAEEYSQAQPGGRLPVSLLLALDEAANICRWSELPNLYSHFGSRGIIPMTILQSWAQGEDVWGKAGMEKLWSAATIKVVGSGVGGGNFLTDLSTLIGEWEKPTRSYQSSSRGMGPSRTSSHTRERIMDPADIGALPRGRAIVIGAGSRPTLCRTIPWMETEHADAIRKSLNEAAADGDPQPGGVRVNI